MTTRGQKEWNCPGCGKHDKEVFSRRRLRVEKMKSRTGRRLGVKSGDVAPPRNKLARLVKQKRREHMESCSEVDS